MAGQLEREIKQTRPFGSLEQEAHLNLLRTALLHDDAINAPLKRAGITGAQYNVLRVLRGAGTPLACRELAERMIHKDPDITRLLDRLEKGGLVRRTRSAEDRRVVVTEITARGRRLLEELDEPVARAHREQLGHLGEAKLRTLIELLEEARQRPA